MAQASAQSSLKEHAESSTSTSTSPSITAAAAVSRNNDPMSIALRSKGSVELDEVVRLFRVASPSSGVLSTLGTTSTAVFSSYRESSGTKPTSLGTTSPVQAKGKAPLSYPPSLSATNGSASEAEAEKAFAFTCIGDWTAEAGVAQAGVDPVRPLRGTQAEIRPPRANLWPKIKKPVVIIQNNDPCPTSSEDECPTTVAVSHRGSSRAKKYLRRRTHNVTYGTMALAEEGRALSSIEHAAPFRQPLSRARFYTLIALVTASIFTIASAAFAAYYTGKARVAYTKGIIFIATVMISVFTVAGMVVARRALLEALLAGLLEFIIGFGLVVEIREFM